MRTCLFLVPPLAVVLAACGGSQGSTGVTHAVTQRQVCSVRIYFSRQATHTQEQALGAKLRDDSLVKRVVFISRAQAFAEMPKQFRKVAKQLKLGNPLPDAFKVLPHSSSDTRQIGASVTHAPGVASVKLTPCLAVT